MIRAGDEVGLTQNGNNNVYCQDNELSWQSWKLNDEQKELLSFVQKLIHFCRKQPVLHRRKFLQGRAIRGSGIKDVSWFEPSGEEMTDEAWHSGSQSIGLRYAGDVIDEVDENGERIVGDTLLILMNASAEKVPFTLPKHFPGQSWEVVFDTNSSMAAFKQFDGGQVYDLVDRSMAAFRIVPAKEKQEPAASAKGKETTLS
jgi:glycogen operon protein